MAFGAQKGTLTGAANSITNPISATGSVAVAVGDLVFGVCGEQTSLTVTACADNLGNTYTATNAGTDAGTSTGRAFYSRVTKSGTLTSVDFTATASSDNVAVFAVVIEGGFKESPVDKNIANTTADITSPFTCPATGTLTQAQEVIVAWAVATGNTTWSATSPNILAGQQATQTVLHTVIGSQAVNATTTVSPEFTAGSNPTDAVLGTTTFMAFTDIVNGKVPPNPIGPAWAQVNRIGQCQASNMPLITADWTKILRDPTIYRWEKTSAAGAQSQPAINLLNTTLAGVAPPADPPFEPIAWPNPRGYQQPVVFNSVNLLNTALFQVNKPFNQIDWPNPRGAKGLGLEQTKGSPPTLAAPDAAPIFRGPTSYRYTKLSSLSAVLAGSRGSNRNLLVDTLYGDPGEVPAFEWPQPRSDADPGLEQSRSTPPILLAQLILPARQLDWPNPTLAAKGLHRDYQQQTNLELLQDAGTQPTRQLDWPNPRGKLVPQQWMVSGLDTPLVVVLSAPFNQTDWQNPVLRKFQQTVEQQPAYATQATPPAPFAQDDWPNPRGYKYPTFGIQQSGLALNDAVRPFYQNEWPNPVLGTRTYSYEQRANAALLTPPVKPFNQLNWPVPPGYRRKQSDEFQTISIAAATFVPPVAGDVISSIVYTLRMFNAQPSANPFSYVRKF